MPKAAPSGYARAAFVEIIEANGNTDMRMSEEGEASIIELRAVGSP